MGFSVVCSDDWVGCESTWSLDVWGSGEYETSNSTWEEANYGLCIKIGGGLWFGNDNTSTVVDSADGENYMFSSKNMTLNKCIISIYDRRITSFLSTI